MKVLFALSTDKVSDLIVQKYQQKYGELLDFKKVYFFDAILRELEKDTNYDSIIIDESLEGKFKDSDLVKKIATIYTAAVKGDNTKIPLILILTPERVAGVPILYSLYNMGINNALLGTDRKFSKICELIVRPRNAKEAKEYYVIDAKDPDFEEQVVELVPEAQIINIKKFYKNLEKEKYSETFDKIARQYSDVELLYIIDKLPEEIKETLKASNDKFNEIIKNSNSIQTKIREAKKEKLNTSVNIQNDEDDPFSNESLLRKQEYIQKINMNNNPQKFNQNVDNNSADKAENTINNVLSEEKQNQNQPQKQEEQVIEEKREELKEENKESAGIDNQNEQVNIYNNEKIEANEINENNEFSKQVKTEEISEKDIKKEELSDVDQEIENLKKELEQISLEEKQLEQPEESKIEENNSNNNNDNNDFDNEQKNNHEALNDGIKEEKEESEEIQLGKEQEQEELIPNVQDNKVDDDIEIEFEEEKEEPKEVHFGKEGEKKEEEQKIKDNKVDDDIEIEFEEEKEEPKKVQLEKREEPKQEENNNNNNNAINNSNKQIQKPIRIDSINNDRVTEDISDIGLEETDIKDFKSGIEKSKEEEINKKLEPSNNVIVSEKNSQQDQEQKTENKIDIEEIKNIGEIIPEEVNKKIKTNVENNNANINIDQNKPTNNVVENNKGNQINNNNNNNNNNNKTFNNQQNPNIATLNNQNNQRHNIQNVHKNMNNNYNKVPNVGMHNNQNINANPNMKNIHNMNNMNSMRNIQARNGYAPKENFDPKILEKYVNNKSAIFVGTSKSGVTFMINSLAMIFASIGINTAILDMTRNKNDYYMTTDNNEELRNIAAESINKLKHGIAEGIQLNRNLTMYTGTPFDNSCYGEAGKVLTTLYNNHTVVLIDADYSTPKEYFAYANNIFAIQTLDILTMQPLTHFMKELKKANILNDEKIKIIINKELPVKGLNKKLIIGGLSTYNSPTMSSMEQLFNRNTVNVFSVPFDIGVYQRYLTNIVECKLDITGYPKPFIEQLKLIANNIYTLENKGKEKIVIQNEFRPQGGPNMQNGMNNMGNMRRY